MSMDIWNIPKVYEVQFWWLKGVCNNNLRHIVISTHYSENKSVKMTSNGWKN